MDDRSGLVTFSLALTIIVLASVALSMLVQKRFHFSDTKGVLEQEIHQEAEEIQFLRATLAQAETNFQSLANGADDRVRRHAAAIAKRTSLQEKRDDLTRRKGETEKAIETLVDQIDRYRSDYRKVSWQKAIGESLPKLRTRDGRDYEQVVIVKVTGSGLEVRHEHGYANILARDLGDEWQDRFQWDRK